MKALECLKRMNLFGKFGFKVTKASEGYDDIAHVSRDSLTLYQKQAVDYYAKRSGFHTSTIKDTFITILKENNDHMRLAIDLSSSLNGDIISMAFKIKQASEGTI